MKDYENFLNKLSSNVRKNYSKDLCEHIITLQKKMQELYKQQKTVNKEDTATLEYIKQ